MSSPIFTITARRWYALLCVFPDGTQHASPVWVFAVTPRKTGAHLLDVDFWHALYPEGVQRKTYRLRVIRRKEGYLLTEHEDEPEHRLVLLSEITPTWLQTHLHETPPGDAQEWLCRKFPH